MKIAVHRLVKDEKGAALVLAVILLLVGGLIVSSLLAFMGNGLFAGRIYETRTAELYAADAGVEDAIWKIQNGKVTACPGDPIDPYNMTNINGKSVEVAITLIYQDEGGFIYRVVSKATGDGTGTEVEAYIDGTIVSANYSGILDNVITSSCDYVLQGGRTVVDPPEGEEHGPQAGYQGDWPTAEILANLYWEDVKNEVPYGSSMLDVKNYVGSGIEPLYRDGTLEIVNKGTADLTVRLNGTVYVTDNTLIGMTDRNFTLDLNGHTIFVESDTGAAPEDNPCNPGNQYALKIGTKCTLTGSGCIIAVGGIEFKPKFDCSADDYILVLSIRGKTYMQPNGDFYGTLAGSAEVYIQNGQAHWVDLSGMSLNFPNLLEISRLVSIYSWQVNQQ